MFLNHFQFRPAVNMTNFAVLKLFQDSNVVYLSMYIFDAVLHINQIYKASFLSFTWAIFV